MSAAPLRLYDQQEDFHHLFKGLIVLVLFFLVLRRVPTTKPGKRGEPEEEIDEKKKSLHLEWINAIRIGLLLDEVDNRWRCCQQSCW